MSVREYLKDNVLVFDGSMGTYFAAKSRTPFERCESANVDNPEQIYNIHMEYIDSGCRAIKTNTFAANFDNFDGDYGYLKEVITKGWDIANKAAKGRGVFVFADIGPVQSSGDRPTGEKYIETADIFLELGAENFLIETLYNDDGIYELAQHIKATRPESFIIVSFAVQPDGYTKDGLPGYELLKGACESPFIDFAGLNCVSGPHHTHQYFRTIRRLGENFSVMPNAGYPTVISSRTLFESSPMYFASKICDIVRDGAKIVGGCCGTTPDYIRETVNELSAGGIHRENYDKNIASAKSNRDAVQNNRFANKLFSGKKVVAVELDPPADADISKFLQSAKLLKNAGIDILTIADCPIAKARADSSILACKVRREFDLDTLPHITCRDRNVNATKALLLGLNIEGVHNVLIVTGDPIPSAMRDEVKSVFNFNSRMLAKFITALNETVFEQRFLICGALNVNSKNFDIQLKMAKEKEANGVEVFLTQPVMTKSGYENLKTAKRELSGKILAGIMPVVSYRNACFMESEISGINVDKEIIELFKNKTKEESISLGVKIAVDIAEKVKDFCDGYYFIAPFGKADMVCEIIEKLEK